MYAIETGQRLFTVQVKRESTWTAIGVIANNMADAVRLVMHYLPEGEPVEIVDIHNHQVSSVIREGRAA